MATRSSSGVMLDLRPFRAFLRRRIRLARAAGYLDPKGRVASEAGVSVRTLSRWLEGGESIDEARVDEACSRIGALMVWELYGEKAVEFDPVDGEPDRVVRVVGCRDPGCGEMAVPGGRFCAGHAERLAVIRAGFEADAAVMAANGGASRRASKAKRADAPTCCQPNCWNPREPGVRFCEACVAEGWTEASYE